MSWPQMMFITIFRKQRQNLQTVSSLRLAVRGHVHVTFWSIFLGANISNIWHVFQHNIRFLRRSAWLNIDLILWRTHGQHWISILRYSIIFLPKLCGLDYNQSVTSLASSWEIPAADGCTRALWAWPLATVTDSTAVVPDWWGNKWVGFLPDKWWHQISLVKGCINVIFLHLIHSRANFS